MTLMKLDRSIGVWIMTVIAVVFGLLTIKSGGSVLFVDGIAREDAGNYVPFVLWFNFRRVRLPVCGSGLVHAKTLGCVDIYFYCCHYNARFCPFGITHTQ